jgi:GH15 family glucan-1,4-alpha-glucosidase
MLDKDKGGHFSIAPQKGSIATTKQQYLPSSNVLQTRHLSDEGVLNVVDFFPRPNEKPPSPHLRPSGALRVPSPMSSGHSSPQFQMRDDPKRWLVRRVECIRGEVTVGVEVFPVRNRNVLFCANPEGFQLWKRQAHYQDQDHRESFK